MSTIRKRGSFCPKCGAKSEQDDLFCVVCGAKLARDIPAAEVAVPETVKAEPETPAVIPETETPTPKPIQAAPEPVNAVPEKPVAEKPVPEMPAEKPIPEVPAEKPVPEKATAKMSADDYVKRSAEQPKAAPQKPAASPVPPVSGQKTSAPQKPASSFVPPSSSRNTSAPARESQSEPPKRRFSFWRSLLLSLVATAIVYGVYSLFDNKPDQPRTALGNLQVPTVALKSAETAAPQLTLAPVYTPIPTQDLGAMIQVPTLAPISTQNKTSSGSQVSKTDTQSSKAGTQSSVWDFMSAPDSEIRACTAVCFYGEDTSQNVKCALCFNEGGTRGGFIWWIRTGKGVRSQFAFGDIVDSETELILKTKDGLERHAFTLNKDKTITFSLAGFEGLKGSVRLKQDAGGKKTEDGLKLLFAYKHAMEKMK